LHLPGVGAEHGGQLPVRKRVFNVFCREAFPHHCGLKSFSVSPPPSLLPPSLKGASPLFFFPA
jgi:hypothetical protein